MPSWTSHSQIATDVTRDERLCSCSSFVDGDDEDDNNIVSGSACCRLSFFSFSAEITVVGSGDAAAVSVLFRDALDTVVNVSDIVTTVFTSPDVSSSSALSALNFSETATEYLTGRVVCATYILLD